MRGATEATKKVKKVFTSLKNAHGKLPRPAPSDAVTQLILGVFSRNMPEAKARELVEKLRAFVVDYNELRVIPPAELAEHLGGGQDIWRKCEDVSRALNHIFAIEHAVTLDRVKAMPKKEMLAYLDRVGGLEAYTRARIRLLGFEQHAMPLDEAMWAYCLDNELVDSKCSLDEAQAFLERVVAEEDAPEFFAVLKKQSWSDFGAAVKKGQGPRVASIAPNRKSTNMLAEVAGGGQLDEAPLDLDDEMAAELGLEETTPKKKPGKKNALTIVTKPNKKRPAPENAPGKAPERAEKPAAAKARTPEPASKPSRKKPAAAKSKSKTG